MTIKKLPEIFNTCDEPFADTSAIPFYMLANNVSSKLNGLSGDGGMKYLLAIESTWVKNGQNCHILF